MLTYLLLMLIVIIMLVVVVCLCIFKMIENGHVILGEDRKTDHELYDNDDDD